MTIINLVNYINLDLPDAVANQVNRLPVLANPDRLELVGADHDVDVRAGAVDSVSRPSDRHRPRLREAGAEGHVRRRVLVEQAVVIDPLRLPDARGRVDERDLAEPIRVGDRRQVAREPVPIRVAPRREPDEPPAPELPRQVLDHASAEGAWPRAAERPLGR